LDFQTTEETTRKLNKDELILEVESGKRIIAWNVDALSLIATNHGIPLVSMVFAEAHGWLNKAQRTTAGFMGERLIDPSKPRQNYVADDSLDALTPNNGVAELRDFE
jgi:hypothetical protein